MKTIYRSILIGLLVTGAALVLVLLATGRVHAYMLGCVKIDALTEICQSHEGKYTKRAIATSTSELATSTSATSSTSTISLIVESRAMPASAAVAAASADIVRNALIEKLKAQIVVLQWRIKLLLLQRERVTE